MFLKGQRGGLCISDDSLASEVPREGCSIFTSVQIPGSLCAMGHGQSSPRTLVAVNQMSWRPSAAFG